MTPRARSVKDVTKAIFMGRILPVPCLAPVTPRCWVIQLWPLPDASPRYADPMSDAIQRAVASYASAWAERDPARRAALLASAVTDDVRIVIGAGQREIRGRAALDAEIVGLHQRLPVLRVRVTSGIDVQGNLCRFTGVAEGPQGQIGPEASDACECDASGRIRLLFTFAGAALPPADGS
jgi:hypothetical protein